MAEIRPGADFGRMASDIAHRVKALLSPLEDVCRYREQRNDDFASFDVKPRDPQAIAFSVAIAAGGVNIVTPHFKLRELPVTEDGTIIAIVEALLDGRVRRVARLSASGKALAAKTYLRDANGLLLFRNRITGGVLAGWTPTASRRRERFKPYRA
jgi:hypothetical protein